MNFVFTERGEEEWEEERGGEWEEGRGRKEGRWRKGKGGTLSRTCLAPRDFFSPLISMKPLKVYRRLLGLSHSTLAANTKLINYKQERGKRMKSGYCKKYNDVREMMPYLE